MPYDSVEDMMKGVPAMQSMTPKQRKIAFEVFHSAMKQGDDEKAAIAKAIGTAKKASEPFKRSLYAEGNLFVMSFAETGSFADLSDEDLETKEYEILKAGEYYDSRYGKFSIDRAKLEVLKSNFDQNVLQIDVALDANHEPERGALGWIKSLRIEGDRLLMSLKDITTEGKKVLRDKVFKYFSVEFAPFTTVQEGKKVTISDVLKGVALTNRPVIKGMAPTFLSESNSFIDNHDMSVFKKFAETLTKRGKVSADDVTLAKAMYAELSEEEQTEAKPSMEEVEAEAAKTAEAEAKAAEEAKTKAEADAKAAEGGSPEAVQAAETKRKEAETKLAEANSKVEALLAEKKERMLSEQVSKFMLSETNTKGFAKVNEDAVKGFMASLDDGQLKQFSDLMGKYVTVDVRELGSGSDANFADGKVRVGATEYKVKDADIDAEIKALAESKKISYFEAAQQYAESKVK